MSPDQPVRHPLTARIADVDREGAIAHLREQCVAGRLTVEELSTRIRSVYEARTRADLEAVTHDLPSVAASSTFLAPAGATLRKATRWTVACLSSETRRGRWRLDGHTNAFAFMGSCTLDLRQVALDGSEVTIAAYAFMGSVEIIVPEGVEVDLSGFSFMGSKDCRVNDGLLRPGAPVIRVLGYACLASISVKSRPVPNVLAAGALL